MKSIKVCITTKLITLASLLFKGLVTTHKTVKWKIFYDETPFLCAGDFIGKRIRKLKKEV